MEPWFTLDQFRSYLELEPLSSEYKRRNPRDIQEYKASYPKRFICPSATYALNNSEDSLFPIDRSYGLNAHLYSQTSNITRSNIRNPGDRICISDGMDWWFNYWKCDYYVTYGETWSPPDTYGEAAFRHSEKANTVYWDGHCEQVTPEQLKKTLKPWTDRKYR
jgi:prepilin-type processing-associated H-X9-DG protein